MLSYCHVNLVLPYCEGVLFSYINDEFFFWSLWLQDLRAFGKEKGWCPYFLARHMVQFANVVVYSYQYLLDPKVASIISKEMQKESVVVFDEAHNIDNVCIEALSVSVRRQTIEGARRNLHKINQEIDKYALFLAFSYIVIRFVCYI